MIESRYKIEYVLPDEEEQKPSSFRVLWYILLIPLVLAVVAAITYDFSFKDLSRDSLVLVEKAKVHILNLGDNREINSLQNNNNVFIKLPITTEVSTKVAENKNVTIDPVISIPVIDKYKITISELSSKQESQLKNIQKQIAKNSTLTNNLNKLSEQLVLEQVKNEALNSLLAEQEKDRLELEEQLNKILESSIDDSIKSPADAKINIEGFSILNNNKTIVALDKKVTKDGSNLVTVQTTALIQTPKKKEEDQELKQIEQSDTDKIIQAMTTISTDKNKTTEAEKSATIELEVTKEVESQPKKPIESLKADAADAVVKTDEKVTKEITKNKELFTYSSSTTIANEVNILATKNESKDKDNNKSIQKTSDENITTQEDIKLDSELAKKAPSPVDIIIAAMEESSQSNASKVNEASVDKKPNIDQALEKDIKQQLLEKGEVSVDKQ